MHLDLEKRNRPEKKKGGGTTPFGHGDLGEKGIGCKRVFVVIIYSLFSMMFNFLLIFFNLNMLQRQMRNQKSIGEKG